MDEQMIAEIASKLAELPCRDMQGVSVGFHDLDIMRRREAATAAHSVMAGKVAELTEAARPFAESIVIDPNKKRGERHWSTFGKTTTIEDVLRLQAALAPYPERRSE